MFVIFDMSSIALVDTEVAYQLVAMGQALKLIGATPVLAGINPSIAEIINQLDIHLDGFIIRRDLHHALTFVIRQLQKEP
jgi:rsbT antagonist protein RsbS